MMLIISIAVLVGCHSGPIVSDPFGAIQDPLDRIAAQVIAAGTARHCAPVQLRVGPESAMIGCVAFVGGTDLLRDTAYYYYQDLKGSIIIAGREWHGHGEKTTDSIAHAIQAQLVRAYGAFDACSPRKSGDSAISYMHRQWHTPDFTVNLVEFPKTMGPNRYFVLQFIKWSSSCDADNEVDLGIRPIILAIHPNDVISRDSQPH